MWQEPISLFDCDFGKICQRFNGGNVRDRVPDLEITV